MEGQQEHNNDVYVPEQLLHGGEHFDDVSRGALRRARYAAARRNNLARLTLFNKVLDQNLVCPICSQ